MHQMNPILKIPQHSDFNIPIFFTDDIKSSYLAQIKFRFGKIEKFLDSCDEKYFRPSIKQNVITRVTGIQEALIDVIEQYLNGHPSKAYSLFKTMLDMYRISDEISGLQQYKIPKNSILFRAQRQYEEVSPKFSDRKGFLGVKQPSDLFHPPFQKRRMVSTNRFSISGYPCLYLSESILTSYSECFPDNNEPQNNFNCIGLQNVRPLYFIDLSNNKLSNATDRFPGVLTKSSKKAEEVSGILSHLGVYHLVMTSHTKVNYVPMYKGEKYYFKAEYIVPQLLLQWLKLEGFAIDGIRYRSCTGARRFPGKLDHYNYVLPVQSNRDRGFCPSLAAVFLFTPVYNYFSSVKLKNARTALKGISKELSKAKFTFLG